MSPLRSVLVFGALASAVSVGATWLWYRGALRFRADGVPPWREFGLSGVAGFVVCPVLFVAAGACVAPDHAATVGATAAALNLVAGEIAWRGFGLKQPALGPWTRRGVNAGFVAAGALCGALGSRLRR
jgi:hypothetical protein